MTLKSIRDELDRIADLIETERFDSDGTPVNRLSRSVEDRYRELRLTLDREVLALQRGD